MPAIWTDESKAALVKEYIAAEPTGATSAEIVKELAPKYDTTVNGARMILVKAKHADGTQVYIAKDAAAAATGTDAKVKKETKQESIDRLTSVIEAEGLTADATVISKLTGKAAAYFADVILEATKED